MRYISHEVSGKEKAKKYSIGDSHDGLGNAKEWSYPQKAYLNLSGETLKERKRGKKASESHQRKRLHVAQEPRDQNH
jgi:hypothetical protein